MVVAISSYVWPLWVIMHSNIALAKVLNVYTVLNTEFRCLVLQGQVFMILLRKGSWALGAVMSDRAARQGNLWILGGYNCQRSWDSPFGTTSEGNWWEDGLQDKSFRKSIFLSRDSVVSFTNTLPGSCLENRKWCSRVIPLSAVFTVLSSKWVVQS